MKVYMTFGRLFVVGMTFAFFLGNASAQNASSSDSAEKVLANPYIDIRTFGARAGASSSTPGGSGNPTGTIANGLKTLTLTGNTNACASSTTCYFIGDWINVFGAGQLNTMNRPSAPNVTPSASTTVPGVAYDVATPAGSTHGDCYMEVDYDAGGGYTRASPETCPSNYLPLGAQSSALSLTRASRSAHTITYTPTTNPRHILAAGENVLVQGMSDGTFNLYCNVATVTSTTFTCVTGMDTAYGASISATGGTVTVWNANRLSLTPYTGSSGICGVGCNAFVNKAIYHGTTGTETLYACNTIPNHSVLNGNSGTAAPDALYWEDYGSKYMANAKNACPAWLPRDFPTAAVNDALIARITALSGSSNTVATLSVAAGNAACAGGGCATSQDNMGALLAADSFASTNGGTCVIPATYFSSFVFNSYGNISHCNIKQLGPITLNGTLQLSGVKIDGEFLRNRADCSQPSFATECLMAIVVGRANPGVLTDTGLSGVSIAGSNTNGGICLFDAHSGSQVWEHDSFYCPGDMGVAFYDFGNNTSGAFGMTLFMTSIFGDTGAPVPALISKNDSQITIIDMNNSRKGLFFGGYQANGFSLKYQQEHEFQGPDMPQLTFARYPGSGNVTSTVKLEGVTTDTANGVVPLILNSNTGGGIFNGTWEIDGYNNSSVMGYPLGSLAVRNFPGGCDFSGQNFNIDIRNCGNGQDIYNKQVSVSGASSSPSCTLTEGCPITGLTTAPIANPNAAPIVTVSASCSGFPPAGTYQYSYYLWDAIGGYTQPGPLSAGVNLDGTSQCAIIALPNAPPAAAVYWSAIAGGTSPAAGTVADFVHGLGACAPEYTPITYTSITDQHSFKCGSGPSTNTSSTSSITPSGVATAKLTTGTEFTSGQCFSSASPATCSAFINGFVTIAEGASSVVVKTTKVTTNSEISLTFDMTQGRNLGVTCNKTAQQPYISARTPGTSFTISVPSTFSGDPGCIGFHIKN